MNWIILLFIVGLILLSSELLVPGVIMGVTGGIAMGIGVVTAFVRYGAAGGTVALGVALAASALVLYIELRVLPQTSWGKRFFLKASISSTNQPVSADAINLAGQTGETMTTLAPSGYVLVAGRRYDAYSQSGLIEKGAPIRVVSADNFRVIVAKS